MLCISDRETHIDAPRRLEDAAVRPGHHKRSHDSTIPRRIHVRRACGHRDVLPRWWRWRRSADQTRPCCVSMFGRSAALPWCCSGGCVAQHLATLRTPRTPHTCTLSLFLPNFILIYCVFTRKAHGESVVWRAVARLAMWFGLPDPQHLRGTM